MVISCSTASCERGFSNINLVKTNMRTKLTQLNLRNQLMIMCEGPEIKDFKCEPSIEHWLLPSERKHHVSGHKLPGPRNKITMKMTLMKVYDVEFDKS